MWPARYFFVIQLSNSRKNPLSDREKAFRKGFLMLLGSGPQDYFGMYD